jgi:hypothetical protein
MTTLSLLLIAAQAFAEPAALPVAPPVAPPPANTGDYVQKNYTRSDAQIAMRDGVHLYTTIYSPKGVASAPILMMRTPYGIHPYEADKHRNTLGPTPWFLPEKYIFVYQDVRGCYMSEGVFENMRPQRRENAPVGSIDESTDTYDTIDWLVKNVPGNNGKVGLYGISYPGFYTSAGMIDHHPNLVAASPQAPIADWYFDDFMHHGAFFQMHAFNFFSMFGLPRPLPSPARHLPFRYGTNDGYRFYLEAGTAKDLDEKYLKGNVAYWKTISEHPTRDEFWKARDLLPHLKKVAPNVLVVGGWFDAEDLYGALNTYRAIEKQNPGIENHLVMGPWYHGGWNRSDGDKLGPLAFGKGNSEFFQRDIELQFFNEHLKGTAGPKLAKAIVFETGDNRWRTFDRWPPAGGTPAKLYFGDRFRLVHEQPTEPSNDAFPSDPRKPVPFFEAPTNTMSREYMTSDQRFVWHRPDVLSYVTEPLPTAVTVAGPLQTHLTVSTTGTDADWIVKLIDVYPDPIPSGHGETDMAGKQILIRSEVVRGRYRTGYDRAVPFIPNEPTVVTVPMQDVLHMFRPGHRLMVQISSTWFPLIDRNPQKFVPNIFLARESDFEPATHRVFRGPGRESWLELEMLPAQPAGPARESR